MADYSYTEGDGLAQLSAATPDGATERIEILDDAIRQIKAYLHDATVGPAAEVAKVIPVGTMFMWALPLTELPDSFIVCDGRSVSSELYPDLYELYSTAGFPYSSEEDTAHRIARTPNMVRRSPYGPNSEPEQEHFPNHLGAVAGDERLWLTLAQLPAHVHQFKWTNNQVISWRGGSDTYAFAVQYNMQEAAKVHPPLGEPTQGGQPHNNTHRVHLLHFVVKGR